MCSLKNLRSFSESSTRVYGKLRDETNEQAEMLSLAKEAITRISKNDLVGLKAVYRELFESIVIRKIDPKYPDKIVENV